MKNYLFTLLISFIVISFIKTIPLISKDCFPRNYLQKKKIKKVVKNLQIQNIELKSKNRQLTSMIIKINKTNIKLRCLNKLLKQKNKEYIHLKNKFKKKIFQHKKKHKFFTLKKNFNN